MGEIRAFVGHSFTQGDSEVVGKFLKYLDQIVKLHPRFSWEHAEPAEPRLLADKVLSLLRDKTLFIAICTQKEYVVDPRAVTDPPLWRRFKKVDKTAVCWKTSDWIIQEIGLAKGKGLEIMLLIERGVRDPGGLQGDVEYIPFDRTEPEKAFGKILEMITALSPREADRPATSGDMQSVLEKNTTSPQSLNDEDWLTPDSTWTREKYGIAFTLTADVVDNQAQAEAISVAYLATDDAAQGDNRDSWNAFCEFIRLRYGKGGSLSGLRDLAVKHPHSSGTLKYLAAGLEIYHDYAESASTYEAAAKECHQDTERLRLLQSAAVAHARAEAPVAAAAIIDRMKTDVETTGIGELVLLDAIREVAEISKDNEVVLAALERMVYINPSDTHVRFSLAYKHSLTENNDLALFHYLRIPRDERTPMTWNNLGVTFDQSGLSAKSVEAYRVAEKMGETLAMSNIAEKLISAGFLEEAQQKCSAALQHKNYHKNVSSSLARLRDIPDVENRKENEILAKIKRVSEFYSKCGQAMARIQPRSVSKYWRGPDCMLEVSVHGNEFRAVGSYEQPSLALGWSAFSSLRSKPAPDHYQIEYRGTLIGRSIIKVGVTRRLKDDLQPVTGLLGGRDSHSIAVMIFADELDEISVMETTKATNERFYKFTRERPEASRSTDAKSDA